MAKELTPEEIQQTENDLHDSKSTKRRSAAKKIGKFKLYVLGDALYNAYMEERNDTRTWETQYEMILALGHIDYKKALPEIEEIVSMRNNNGAAEINAAVRTFVRLKRKSLNDIKPVLDLLKSDNPNIINGAVSVLTFDDMIPTDKDIRRIIAVFDSKFKDDVFSMKGTTDPRSYLISAMSKWNKSICEPYIKRFIDSSDLQIKKDAESALKGKKSRTE